MSRISKGSHRHSHTVQLRQIEEISMYNPSLFDQLIAENHSDINEDSFPMPVQLEEDKYETLTHQADVTPLIGQDFFMVENQNFIEQREVNHKGKAMRAAPKPKLAKKLPKVKRARNSCNCNRMKCDKRYCSCFKNGNSCSQACQCKDCNNHQEAKKSANLAIIRLEPFWRFEWDGMQQP